MAQYQVADKGMTGPKRAAVPVKKKR